MQFISKITIAAFILLSLSLANSATRALALAPTPTPVAGAIYATVTADNLRVRSTPGTDGVVLGSFNKGDLVQILARNADSSWWQIAYPDPNRRGWVSAQFISPIGPTDSIQLAPPSQATATRTLAAQPSSPIAATATPSPSATLVPQNTPTDQPLPTLANTPTDTPPPSATATASSTLTNTPTVIPTNTATPSPTPPGRDPKRALFITGTDQIIAPRAKIWYRFEYLGDRSPITVGVDGFGVKDLDVLMYTPEQVNGNFDEPTTQAVGRGGGNRNQTGHDVFWTGSFATGGTGYIAIVNSTTRGIVFRLGIAGQSVVTTPYQLPSTQQSGNANPTDSASNPSGIRIETGNNIQPAGSPALPFAEIDTSEVRGNRAKWIRDYFSGANLLAASSTQSSNDPLTTIYVIYPPELGMPPFPRTVPIPPPQCTPPEAIGIVITQTIKLCANATYRNLNVTGSRIGIFQDDGNTALVKSDGRSFAITVVGSEVMLQGLKIQATTDPQDRGKWVCAFDKCKFGDVFVQGGPIYGGGVSISGSNMIVKDTTITGGTIGVALLEGTDNFLINNHLLFQTGWASYNRYPQRAQFLGNQFNWANRDCRGPDGIYYSQGCETAGWICISCVETLVVNNECKHGGNCYYVSGDGGTPSYNVKFYGNTCFAAPNNCFEATFSKGIYFEGNQAKKDPNSGENCNYPFWIGGSEVTFGKGNEWACLVSASTAQTRSGTTGVQGGPPK